MREINSIENVEQEFLPEQFSHIFSQLNPQEVEQFYKGYQLWTLQKQIELQQLQIATLEQKIAENAEDPVVSAFQCMFAPLRIVTTNHIQTFTTFE